MRITYTTQKSGFVAGENYANPRFFSSVNPAATEVVVVGDWPAVVAAYEAADVPVTAAGAAALTVPSPAPRAPRRRSTKKVNADG
ncbi:hypothetical protein FHS82_001048 [Pseudochelatococcus lubricantis]|uniref:Uncharacterized protein n=1 Tax=Pseudochelatococcus lubricantis TaxID=1538102 RepID=A0ABX0UWT2_9HYPH|nr:hypothetical protein [Pseudochelatococcus lubricantis]NIJ57222.1 hypothetical protein [Pseudochelatococcus lubricantis]